MDGILIPQPAKPNVPKDLQNKYFSLFFDEIAVFPTLFAGTVFDEKWVDSKSVKSFGKFVASTLRMFRNIFGGDRFYPPSAWICNNKFKIAKNRVAQNIVFSEGSSFGVTKIRPEIESKLWFRVHWTVKSKNFYLHEFLELDNIVRCFREPKACTF